MKVLDLILKHKWYDMIASGEKKEEYREIKKFYWKRLIDLNKFGGCYKGCTDYYQDFKPCLNCKCMNWKYYDAVRFHRGYTNTTMLVECKGITIGRGKPEWGAPDYEVYIIKLGNILP